MERFTISLPGSLAEAFDEWLRERGYTTRSEAVRDLVRNTLEAAAAEVVTTQPAVAALSYVYDHQDHTVSGRVTEAQHQHHECVAATMHAHLDHDRCLEVSVLRGPRCDLVALASNVLALRGIRHGHLHLICADQGIGPWTGTSPPHEHAHGEPSAVPRLPVRGSTTR